MRWKCIDPEGLIEIEVFHRFIQSLRDMRRGWGSSVLPHASGWTGRLVNLEVNAGIVLHPHHTEENSYRLGGIAASADNFTHVVRVHVEGHKHAHFIHRSLDFDI